MTPKLKNFKKLPDMTKKSQKATRESPLTAEALKELMKSAIADDLAAYAEKAEQRKRHFLRTHLEYLYFLAIGADRKQVAEALNLSIRTVEAHYGTLLELLDCLNAAHMVGRAFELGLLIIDEGKVKMNKEALL